MKSDVPLLTFSCKRRNVPKILLIDFRFGENDSEDSTKTGLQLIYATGRQMKNKKQLLLLPITIWSGLEQGFFGADFTAVIYSSQVQFLNIWSTKNSFEKKLQSVSKSTLPF